jgi:hypothetical protein
MPDRLHLSLSVTLQQQGRPGFRCLDRLDRKRKKHETPGRRLGDQEIGGFAMPNTSDNHLLDHRHLAELAGEDLS